MLEIITIAVLILSIVLHEVAHGYAANWLGDPTARLQGRLSPNPLLHIDPMGSVIIPGFLFLSGAPFIFGYAKPVPYNPYNLRDQRWGEAIVAAAGPLANILLAVIFAALIRSGASLGIAPAFLDMAAYIVFINILLAVFNIIPFPPLDGSKVLPALLPFGLSLRYKAFTDTIEGMGVMGLLLSVFVFLYILWTPFSMVVRWLYRIFLGI